jgi:hypothetical protein
MATLRKFQVVTRKLSTDRNRFMQVPYSNRINNGNNENELRFHESVSERPVYLFAMRNIPVDDDVMGTQH